MRPIREKALWAGCTRICLEDALCAKFGATKRASTLGTCKVIEHTYMICFLVEIKFG